MSDSADRPRLCVLGSIIVDHVVHVPRLPLPGETLLGGPLERYPGGKGANQAVAAARCGAQVAMIGTLGADDAGRSMLHTLTAEGLDVSQISVDASAPTGSAVIAVAPDGNNSIIVSPGANSSLTVERVLGARPLIAAADALVLQLEVPLETALAAVALARDCGTTVVLNAAPVPPGGVPAELLAASDVLVVNETEADALAPSAGSIDAVLQRLCSRGPRTVIATLGESGLRYLSQHGSIGGVDAFRVHAIDSTGAGDAFVGAFAVRWAEHQIGGALDPMGVLDALCWGAAAGALAATIQGAMPSLPRRGDIVALLRKGSTPP